MERIDWRKTECKLLNHEQWNEHIDILYKNGTYIDNDIFKRKNMRTGVDPFFGNETMYSFTVDTKPKKPVCYIFNREDPYRPYFYRITTNSCNPDEEIDVYGYMAFNAFNNLVEKDFKLKDKFGTLGLTDEDKKYRDLLEDFQYNPPLFQNIRQTRKVFDDVCKADISSAYPYQLKGKLPDWNTKKEVHGYVMPDREYIFAFYPDTKDIAIYGELSTRMIKQSALWKQCQMYEGREEPYSKFVSDKPITKTILMKASDVTLDKYIDQLYELKQKDNTDYYKKVMNLFIGYLRSNGNHKNTNRFNYMGHVTAVVYARHWKYMSALYDEIIQDNIPLVIATDSIVWKGKMITQATNDKYLGAFHIEAQNTDCIIFDKQSHYVIRMNNQFVVKSQGVTKTQNDEKLFSTFTRLEQFIEWFENAKVIRFNKITNMFEEK